MGYYDDLIKRKKFFNIKGTRMLALTLDETQIDESVLSIPWNLRTEVFNETFALQKKEVP